MPGKDYFVGADPERLPRETLEQLRTYGACVVSDALRGFNAMDGASAPSHRAHACAAAP